MDTKTSTYHLTHHHHHLHQQTKKQTSATAVIVRSRPVQFAQTLARVFRIGRKEKISKKAANKVCGQDDQFIFKLYSTQSRFSLLPGRTCTHLQRGRVFSRPAWVFIFFLPDLPPSEIRWPERAAPSTTAREGACARARAFAYTPSFSSVTLGAYRYVTPRRMTYVNITGCCLADRFTSSRSQECVRVAPITIICLSFIYPVFFSVRFAIPRGKKCNKPRSTRSFWRDVVWPTGPLTSSPRPRVFRPVGRAGGWFIDYEKFAPVSRTFVYSRLVWLDTENPWSDGTRNRARLVQQRARNVRFVIF